MPLSMLAPAPQAAAGLAFPAYTDDVIPALETWTAGGLECALVTLVTVDGNAPRALGAQMAVAQTGQWCGYISGGCIEPAVALEAMEVIASTKPRLVRYGKGSPYMDIRLPCGSGLDLLVQPFSNRALIGEMVSLAAKRQAFALRLPLAGQGDAGLCVSEPSLATGAVHPLSCRAGNDFMRAYAPPLRLIVAGSSPIAASLAQLGDCSGFDVVFYAADIEAVPPMPPGVTVRPMRPPYRFELDAWTAAILAFHDHDLEIPILSELVSSPCFHIAAIGSRKAHEVRKLSLEAAGHSPAQIARIQSPAGFVPGLKRAPHVALSILTQAIAVARERDLIS